MQLNVTHIPFYSQQAKDWSPCQDGTRVAVKM